MRSSTIAMAAPLFLAMGTSIDPAPHVFEIPEPA
jgi:hypothetical protein